MDDLDLYSFRKRDYIQKNFSDTLISFTPDITDVIKSIGIFTRYFGTMSSRKTGIVEIDGANYSLMSKNAFYVTAKLNWYIKGPKYTTIQTINGNSVEVVGVEESNKEAVKEVLLTMPGLASYITDYLQYWQGE